MFSGFLGFGIIEFATGMLSTAGVFIFSWKEKKIFYIIVVDERLRTEWRQHVRDGRPRHIYTFIFRTQTKYVTIPVCNM